MRRIIRTITLALPLVAAPAFAAAVQHPDPHAQATQMVARVLGQRTELGLTAGEVKSLEQYQGQLKLVAKQRQASSKPQNTNTVLGTTPDQARARILEIVGDEREDGVRKVLDG